MPLNGAGANTEGGRLSRMMRANRTCYDGRNVSSGPLACVRGSIQFPFTQTENSRITLLNATNNATLLNGGGVTQARARQVLAATLAGVVTTETVYITALQERTIACSDDSPTLKPVIIPACPALPPPPGPPAPVCILAKNQKF